jgi:hypothetical protein
MAMENESTSEELSLSSIKAHELLFAECANEGMMLSFGSRTEPVVNYNVKANPENALAMKRMFEKVLVDMNQHGPQAQMVVFNAPDNEQLHGKWSVSSGRVLRGRNGQVALTLMRGDTTVEVWSRRIVSVVCGTRVLLASGEVLDWGSVDGLPQ